MKIVIESAQIKLVDDQGNERVLALSDRGVTFETDTLTIETHVSTISVTVPFVPSEPPAPVGG